MFHLTGFQKDCLYSVAAEGPCGVDDIVETLERCHRSVPRRSVLDDVSTLVQKGYVERAAASQGPDDVVYSLARKCERQLEGGLLTRIALEGPKSGLAHVSNIAYHNAPPGIVVPVRKWTNALRHDVPPEPVQRVWIDPDRITHRMDARLFSNRNDRGKVLGGEWDRITTRFSEHPIYWGLRDRFENGTSWRDTAYFRWCRLRLRGRGEAFGCTTEEQLLEDRCAYVDRLHDEIETNGYQTQEEADLTFSRRRHQDSTEISANVGRNGELLLYDGHHRLAIAKILGVERIPIELVVRHSEWQKLRNSVSASVDNAASDAVEPEREDHPDLRTISAQ